MDERHLDSRFCKKIFTPTNDGMRFPRQRQCRRKPWKDGYCKQHHPDAEEARKKRSEAHYNSTNPWRLLDAATKTIEGLRKEIALLKRKLDKKGK